MIVFTGAAGVGKTTTLRRVEEALRLPPVEEAHRETLRALGARRLGHPAGAPLRTIEDPHHLCPVCRPVEFSELVLARQRRIEARAPRIVDRGLIDPLELRSRWTGEALRELVQPLELAYERAFVFEVMEALVQPRWGRGRAARAVEARAIEARLEEAYARAGVPVTRVPPGSVEARARFVLARLGREEAS